MEIKVLVLSCPEGTIFDERKIQCLPENKASQPCTGTIATARFYRRLEQSSTPTIKVSTQQLCPEEGHYPYKSGCNSLFYNCKRNSRNDLQGYLYKCPENFLYWSVSRRCERAARLPLCGLYKSKENIENWEGKWQIPVEESNLSARSLFR
ncbi:uncharacterized protein LOC122532734 [Frieseomelitta varia]|uniref:uncharacterized protein LOC122532734 n=1 Tax=Frieseomelitta varia TaxID=561572 RepID=UPI001CB6802C|nr:uncharacterized protein LOC122532734 [Frieseomelitta varia]